MYIWFQWQRSLSVHHLSLHKTAHPYFLFKCPCCFWKALIFWQVLPRHAFKSTLANVSNLKQSSSHRVDFNRTTCEIQTSPHPPSLPWLTSEHLLEGQGFAASVYWQLTGNNTAPPQLTWSKSIFLVKTCLVSSAFIWLKPQQRENKVSQEEKSLSAVRWSFSAVGQLT